MGAEASAESKRIVLVDGTDALAEVKPLGDDGRNLLGAVMATLEVAQNAGLVERVPFSAEAKAPTMITVEGTLKLATAAYRAKPDSTELLAEFNQAFWYARQQKMGVSRADLVVADCPYSEAGIRGFMENDFGLFVPPTVSTAPAGLILLGKAFPAMGSWAFQEETAVLNVDKNGNPIDIHGWMTTERGIDAPHTKTDQIQAETITRKAHRVGDTLNVYAVVSQQSKELTDRYLDEGRTWTRVLSSRYGGQVLFACFYSLGFCCVYWGLEPGDVFDGLGARSVEVAKT